MADKVTLPALHAMKRGGKKIVGVVAWDFQIARVADRADVDMVSVGEWVGMNLWGRTEPEDMTLEEMILVCKAVRGGGQRGVVGWDFPYGVLQQGVPAAIAAARRVRDEGGADVVKLDEAAEFPNAVRAIADAGIPVFAQMGITQGNAAKYGIEHAKMLGGAIQVPEEMAGRLVEEAKRLESSGAVLIDFTSSGPVSGARGTAAVPIPVVDGLGCWPWLSWHQLVSNPAID